MMRWEGRVSKWIESVTYNLTNGLLRLHQSLEYNLVGNKHFRKPVKNLSIIRADPGLL